MAYPSVISTFTNPTPSIRLSITPHSAIETAQNTDLIAIETFVGTLSSIQGSLTYDIRAGASNGGGHVQTASVGGTGFQSYTKGDLIVGQSASVLAKLPVGTDGKVLTADSSQSNGVSWASVASAASSGLAFPLAIQSVPLTSSSIWTLSGSAVTLGTVTTGGMLFQTNKSGGNDFARYNWVDSNHGPWLPGITMTGNLYLGTGTAPGNGGTGELFVGLGTVTTANGGHTFTDNHVGIKLVFSSLNFSVLGTTGNGSTESTVLIDPGGASPNDTAQFAIQVVSSVLTKFSYRKSSATAAWDTVASIVSNIPTSNASQGLQISNTYNGGFSSGTSWGPNGITLLY